MLNIISRVTQSESDEISIGSSLLLLSIGSSSRELFTARLSSSSSSDKQIRIFAYPSFGVLSTGGAGVGAETCDGDGNGDMGGDGDSDGNTGDGEVFADGGGEGGNASVSTFLVFVSSSSSLSRENRSAYRLRGIRPGLTVDMNEKRESYPLKMCYSCEQKDLSLKVLTVFRKWFVITFGGRFNDFGCI